MKFKKKLIFIFVALLTLNIFLDFNIHKKIKVADEKGPIIIIKIIGKNG